MKFAVDKILDFPRTFVHSRSLSLFAVGMVFVAFANSGWAQTVNHKSDAGNANWANSDAGGNNWNRTSDGWDIRRPDLATGQWSAGGTKAYVDIQIGTSVHTTMTVNGDQGGAKYSIKSLRFQNSTSRSLTNSSGGYLALGGSGTPKIESDSGTGTGTYTFNLPINLELSSEINAVGGNLIFNSAITNGANNLISYTTTGRTLEINGVIGSGSGQVQHLGAGLVILAGNNTYTGATIVGATGGVIQVKHANALGTTAGATTISNGAKLELFGGITTAAEPLTISGDGNGTAALLNPSGGGANTFAGPITLGNSDVRINNQDTGSALTVSGTINFASNTLYVGGSGNTTLSGTWSNAGKTTSNGALYKDGNGVLTLSGANSSATGLVRILAGTASIGSAANIGGGTVEIGGTGTLATTANLTRTAGLLVTDGTNNASQISVATNTTFIQTGAFTGAANSGTKIGKAGPGDLIFNAASGSTYGGQIQIGQGRVIVGTTGALGTNTSTVNRGVDLGFNVGDVNQTNNVAVLASNGVTVAQSFYVTPNTNSATRTIGVISGSATFSNQFYMDGTLTVDAGSSATDMVTMSGNLTNTGAISKTNAGILVLSASNNHSGGTTLGQGTLRLGNANALGTGGLTVNGGTLSSDSTTARTVTNNVTVGGNFNLGEAATGTGDITISGTVGLGAATRTITVNNSSNTISGVISASSGFGLSKAGNGVLRLTVANSYNGTTTVSAGRLSVGAALSSTNITVSGGTFELTANNIVADTAPVTLTAGTLQASGTATDTMGALNVTSTGTIDMGSGDADLTFASLTGITTSLSITNFTAGTDTVVFTSTTGVTEANLAKITVNGAVSGLSGNNIIAATAAGVPTSLAVTPGNGTLTATFVAPSTTGGRAITNYEYSTNGGTNWTAVSPASTSTSISIPSLANGTTYNVQVRAVTAFGGGTATASVAGTPRTTPTVTTTAAANVDTTTATLGGNITATGGENATVRGVEYSTNSGFAQGTGTQASASGSFSTGAFSNNVTGLASSTTYHFRAYASNSAGITYGSLTNFTTLAATATITAGTGTLGALSTTYGTASSSTNFTVSGANMAAGILVTPPSGFEVSTNNSTFASTVTVGAAGTIASTTVHVRLAATAVPGSYSGNIVLSSSGAANVNVATTASTVSTKALTISSPAVTSKTYDGTNTATITGSLSGVVNSNTVTLVGTGTFNNATVGTNKPVTSTSTLGGADASYYTLTQPTGLTGTITALGITGSFTASNKTYDGTNSATVATRAVSGKIGSDDVNHTNGTATFNNATVGTGKTVTLTGATLTGTAATNYTLSSVSTTTANITALGITGSFTASNKVYDGTTTATVATRAVSGKIGSDDVNHTGGTATFNNATVGTGKAVTLTGATLTGTAATNYTLSSVSTTTADITIATPSITAGPTLSTNTIKYARPLSAITLSGNSVVPSAGSWAWTTPSQIPAPGTASYSATWTPTDTTNYTTATTNVSVTSQMAQARNTAGSATPGAPSAIYLGDTNRTFTSETWGAIDGANGSARLVIRYNNSDLSGGISQGFAASDNNDTNTLTSLQFTNTGTWYWGVQMDYGATYGTNFWYKVSTNTWTDMSTNGVGATLSVNVQAVPTPTIGAFSSIGTTNMTVNWTKATNSAAPTGYDVLVLRSTSSGFTDEPVQGTGYSTGNTIGGATVVYKGGNSSQADTGLTPGTTYYYKIYSENWSYYSAAVSTNATTAGTPTITINGSTSNVTTAVFTSTYGTASAAQSFTVAGANLTGDITATAPTGFRVSFNNTNISAYNTNATLTNVGGTNSGTLYIRTSGSTGNAGDYNNVSVTLTSSGATQRNITTPGSGNTISQAALTITASNVTKTLGDLLTSGSVSTGYTVAGLQNSETVGSVTMTYGNGAARTNAVGTYSNTVTPSAATGGTFTASNYNISYGSANIIVSALADPTSPSANPGSLHPARRLDLSWTRANYDVLLLRSTSTNFTEPTNGSGYVAGNILGTGAAASTVVHRGNFSTLSDETFLPGSTYYYKIYSENWSNYSPGVTFNGTTATPQARNANGAASPSVVNVGNTNTSAIFLGDQATFSLDAWGTITSASVTNWGSPRLHLKTSSDLSSGTTLTTNAYTDQTGKSVTSGRFTNSGTYYWGIQMDYDAAGAGNDFWYKSSSASYANLARNGSNSLLTLTVSNLPTPTITSISGAATNQLTINWTRASSVAATGGYDILVVRHTNSSIGDPVNGTAYTNTPTNTTAGTVVYKGNGPNFTDTNLTPGTTYYYRVYAENWSYYSAGVDTNAGTIPSAPATPTISAVTATNFTATWLNPGGATNYFLDVSTVTNFSTFVSGYSNKAVATLSDSVTGLAANTTYYTRVRAQSSGGTSANSATTSQLTPPAAPLVPTAASVLATSFTLNWSSVTGASSYRLDVATDSGFTSFVTGFNSKTVSGTTDSLSGLTAGTTYYARVRAVNAGGTGDNSPTLTVATAASATAPSISSIDPGNTQLTVNFTAGQSGGLTITGYEYSLNAGTYTSAVQTNSPIIITGLTNGTSYLVTLRAVNSDGSRGGDSSGVSATPRTVPGAPSGLTVAPGVAQLTASFTAPSDNGGSAVTNYEYSINGGSTFTAVSPASTSTSITISGLANGTAYNVQVRAVNVAGSGAATASVSGTPRTTPTLTTGGSSAVAAYSAALAGDITATGGANATSRGIEYSTTNGFATGTGTQTSSAGDFSTGAFTNTAASLASRTTYYYRAFASNAAGISYGSQSNFTTLTVPGAQNHPTLSNATNAFLGDTVTLRLQAWQTDGRGNNRSLATVVGRYANADLTSGTVQGTGVNPGFTADDITNATTPRLTNTGAFYWAIRVTYQSNNDYWFDAPRASWSDLGLSAPTNSPLTIQVSALNNPTSPSATNTSTTQINLTWTKGISGDAKNTMIVRSTDTNFTAPTQGAAYAVNSTALGGDTVIYNDGGTNFSDTGLTPGTTYYYRLYAENWSYYSAGADASAATPGTPTITIGGVASNATTTAFTTTYGTPSAAQNFTVGGSNLTANLTATAPAGYQVSTNDSTYTNAVTFTQSSGAASGTLYLRLSGSAAAGSYNSASVTLASTDATNRTITTPDTGNTVSQATPTISALPSVSASVMKGDTLYNGLLTNGTASVAGSFSFSDTSTRQTATGAKALTFTPTDTTNYSSLSTNVSVTVDPVPDPTAVTATNAGTNSINLTHSRASSRNVMIVRRAGSAVDWTPTDGTTYNSGFTTNGQTVVHGSLAADSSTDSGLAVATTYHYKIFSENWGYYSAGVTASATTATPAPSISVSGTVSSLSTTYGTASSPGNFSASGSYLTNDITVSAPTGFEVSTSSGSGYAATVTLTPSSGTVSSTTIYVRLKSNAAPGSNSGNVTLASGGATTQNVAVSGTVSIPAMSMTISSSAGSMNADYTTSKLFTDEVAGTTNNVTISFNTGNANADEVEVWSNLNNRDRADEDANGDGIQDGIVPPTPPTDKPAGYVSGAYPSNGYFQAIPMSGSGATRTLTLNANKTGAYRLTARYRVNGGSWVYYNQDGSKRDHAITVTPVLARNMNVYEINVLNVNATGSDFSTRSTFESLTNYTNNRVNLNYLRNMGVNTLWFQPIHPNGVEGREAPGGTPYDPGSPYAVKNFFEVMEQMSQGNTRSASMTAFTNFVAAADTKGVHVMLDAPFNHTAYDVELAQKGLELLAASGLTTTGWSSTDKIKDREARFFSKNNSGSQYAGPASSSGNIAPAPDRNDFGKWNDVIDVFFGRYSALVTGNPSSGAALNQYKSEADVMNMDDLQGTGGVEAQTAAVTRAVWQYFASYVPYWLEKTGVPAGTSLADQATKGIDGLRADFGQGMPPQFWEYAINVARERKWSFVFMSESLDGGEVTYRSNRHFDILNENIVFPWQGATNTTAHRTIFEDRRNAYGQGLVLLNNTSHDEAGWSDPWQAFIRYAVGSTIDGAPMIMYGQEIGTGASLSFDYYETNFGKSIPHFKRYNSMNPQWNAWSSNSLGVQNLMPNYSGVGLAREFSPALRSSSRWFLNPASSPSTADANIFAVAKYETANASPSTSDVVLAFVNLDRNNSRANTFQIPSALGTLLGLEAGKLYNVKNIAAYLGPNNEYPNRRNEFLWPTPRSGGDIQTNGVYVALNAVPNTDGAWSSAPFEAQYLKVYAAPVITTGSAPGALSSTYGTPSTNETMTFSATDVQDGLTITAPGGFQISTNSSGGFASTLSLTNTGSFSNTLFVRLAQSNNAGNYSGNLTFFSPGGNTNTVALTSSTVGRATPTISTNPTPAAITYGQALSAATLTGGAANVGGSFAFASPGTTPAATVSTGYNVVFTPTDTNNYTPVTNSVNVTVNKKALSVTAPTIASKGYDGTTTAGAVTVGSISGTVGTETVTATATAANYSSADVGSYSTTVTYTLGNGSNGGLAANYSLANDTATGTITAASVASNLINLTPGSGNSYTASGPAGVSLAVTYAGRTANGITTSYSSATPPPSTAAGYYTATATATGNHTGNSSTNFHVAGPVALNDTIQSPTQEINILHSTLLANDRRIHSDGTVQTNGLSISAVANVSGSATRGASYIAYNAGGAGSGSFTYTLSYGEQTATGTVTVTRMDLQANAPTLSITNLPVVAFYDAGVDETSVTVTLVGDPGKMYYVQYRSDSQQPWEDAFGWPSGETGVFDVTILKEGNHKAAWENRMFFKAQVTNP